ncbi:DNA-binding protein [Streptomyces venezuelae]|uniref:DNA-binding protein n=1 Tax=Streptomyces venezuelae TaxID=54571 RepID=A0A5P2D1T9_STRVZ|nr:DNA-binding protein [Streptomyces venezuelae]QES48723.1 DNA-binding protein [Streptomyces venezuelae]
MEDHAEAARAGDDVAAMTAALLETDRTYGARYAAPAALQAVRTAARTASRTGSRRPPGAATLAELFEVAGWILFDAEQHAASYRLNRRALALARADTSRTASVELLTLSVLCMQHAHLGRPRDSLRISSAVLAGPGLPERVAAIFRVREARAQAQMQQRRAALGSLSAARDLLADGPSDRDPAWAWWFDRAELDGHHGLAHAELGDLDRAAEQLHGAAAAGDAPAYRSLFAAELADVLARAGAWREADAWLSTLLDSVPRIGSVRALNALGRAARTIEHAAGVPRALRATNGQLSELLRRERRERRERSRACVASPPV